MSYRIEIDYTTGNSFHTERRKELIELEWTKIKRVKESLTCIQNHYEYCIENGEWTRPKGKLPKGVKWNSKYKCIMLYLIRDDGEKHMYSSFWTGYFEKLHEAKIVTNELSYIPIKH